MELKNIKINEAVKTKLDDLKLETESYSLVIDRLIKENAELKSDKDRLFNIVENLSKN